LLLTIGLAASGAALASGPVTMTLSPPHSSTDAERGIIEVSLRNEGDTPVYMFKPATLADAIFVNVLCIRDTAGGVAEHRINPGKIIYEPEAFTRIDPHSEMHHTVDLDYIYALPDGPVDITYSAQPFYDRPQGDPEPSDPEAGKTRSNTLRIWVNRSLLRPASDHPYWGSEISKNPQCEPRAQAR
jgi:hypothetical protein